MTELPNEKLSPWYFAVKYATMVLQQRIELGKEKDWDTSYDQYTLEKMQDLEQFLKMSWDYWMDELELSCPHALK